MSRSCAYWISTDEAGVVVLIERTVDLGCRVIHERKTLFHADDDVFTLAWLEAVNVERLVQIHVRARCVPVDLQPIDRVVDEVHRIDAIVAGTCVVDAIAGQMVQPGRNDITADLDRTPSELAFLISSRAFCSEMYKVSSPASVTPL